MEVMWWYECPECQHVWASHNREINVEWCSGCNSIMEPEFLYEETSL